MARPVSVMLGLQRVKA